MTAAEGRRQKRRALYIFDEPTTGLHFDDVSKLLSSFRRLIDAGGSILVIEHNLEVIKTADWVIDLGPEGGERGGYVVGAGPPEAIAELPGSYTGQFLARVLERKRSAAARMVASRVIRMRAYRADRQVAAESGWVPDSLAARVVLLVRFWASGWGLSCWPRLSWPRTPAEPCVITAWPREIPLSARAGQAEDDIAKKDFAGAEPLLKTVVERDAGNFQAWFDLGYVDNALGKERRGHCGLSEIGGGQARCIRIQPEPGADAGREADQPGAEQFLRAATKLTPTAEIDEGHARAWMGLAQVLEDERSCWRRRTLICQVATLRPKDPEPRLSAGVLLEKQNHFADAEQQYRQAWPSIPRLPTR